METERRWTEQRVRLQNGRVADRSQQTQLGHLAQKAQNCLYIRVKNGAVDVGVVVGVISTATILVPPSSY